MTRQVRYVEDPEPDPLHRRLYWKARRIWMRIVGAYEVLRYGQERW